MTHRLKLNVVVWCKVESELDLWVYSFHFFILIIFWLICFFDFCCCFVCFKFWRLLAEDEAWKTEADLPKNWAWAELLQVPEDIIVRQDFLWGSYRTQQFSAPLWELRLWEPGYDATYRSVMVTGGLFQTTLMVLVSQEKLKQERKNMKMLHWECEHLWGFPLKTGRHNCGILGYWGLVNMLQRAL